MKRCPVCKVEKRRDEPGRWCRKCKYFVCTVKCEKELVTGKGCVCGRKMIDGVMYEKDGSVAQAEQLRPKRGTAARTGSPESGQKKNWRAKASEEERGMVNVGKESGKEKEIVARKRNTAEEGGKEKENDD